MGEGFQARTYLETEEIGGVYLKQTNKNKYIHLKKTNNLHAGALLCSHFAAVAHWGHSPVAVRILREWERRIRTSEKTTQKRQLLVRYGFSFCKAVGVLPLQVSERLGGLFLFSSVSPTQDPMHTKDAFHESLWEHSLVALHTFFCLSGDWNHFGFEVLHSKFRQCSYLARRHLLAFVEIG